MLEQIKDTTFPSWVYKFKIQAIIIAILSIALYCNTFQGESAFDDSMVIVRNQYVLEGFAGLHDIFTKDTYDSYYTQFNSGNQLEGGRYRPLSIMVFAIEQQFFGAIPVNEADSVARHDMSYLKTSPYEQKIVQEMHVRHVLNVLWYTLSLIALLYFLRYIVLRKNPLLAFLAVIIFTVHPIHTEVVANVKSCDEIFSLLFLCLTFIFAFRYNEQKKISLLMAALASYFLAFLSKEYAITMVVLLPLAFYLFDRYPAKKSIWATLPYFGVALLYILIRSRIIHSAAGSTTGDISINPYAYASVAQAMATRIYTSAYYLRLLFFPHPLLADYSYNTIPYTDFSNLWVWLSVLLYIVMIAGFVYLLRKRSALSFAIAFYGVNLLLVANVLFNIGAPMGERLIYHASVGFAIAAAYAIYYGAGMIAELKMRQVVITGIMAVIVLLFGFKTVTRNADWKNDYTLFFHDVKIAPENHLIVGNAASAYLRLAESESEESFKIDDMRKAIRLFTKALSMNKLFWGGYINRSYIYFSLNQPDSAIADINVMKSLYPGFPKLANMYYNVGVAFYRNKQYVQALDAWKSALQLEPDYKSPQKAIDLMNGANLLPKPADTTGVR